MALISKGGFTNLQSTEQVEAKQDVIAFDIKEVDFLLRKFAELNFSAKDLIIAYAVIEKLQRINKKIMESQVEVNS